MKAIIFFICTFLVYSASGQHITLENKLEKAGLQQVLEKIKKAGLDDYSTALQIAFAEIISKNSSLFRPDFVVNYHSPKDTVDIWYHITLNPPDSLSSTKAFNNFFENKLRQISIVTKDFPLFGLIRMDTRGKKLKAKEIYNADYYDYLGFKPKPELGNYSGGSYYMVYKKRKALVEILITQQHATASVFSCDWLRFTK